jgi:hypothetical protein
VEASDADGRHAGFVVSVSGDADASDDSVEVGNVVGREADGGRARYGVFRTLSGWYWQASKCTNGDIGFGFASRDRAAQVAQRILARG